MHVRVGGCGNVLICLVFRCYNKKVRNQVKTVTMLLFLLYIDTSENTRFIRSIYTLLFSFKRNALCNKLCSGHCLLDILLFILIL